MISIIGATHPGQREHNEDCYIADASQGLGMVADGMGGYACGEVASAMVKQVIEQAVSNNEGLKEAIGRAHALVKEAAAANENKRGMGSTAIAFKIQGMDYELVWVGDSRAYLWSSSDATLKQISRDHSYVETLLNSGAISPQEALTHPKRNLITQAVGVAGEGGLEIEQVHGRLTSGQQLMICSDGLVDEVLDADIAKLLREASTPQQALNDLVEAAVAAGGRDNITVVLASVDAGVATQTKEAIEPEAVRVTALEQALKKAEPPSTALHNDARPGLSGLVKSHATVFVFGLLVLMALVGSLLYLS